MASAVQNRLSTPSDSSRTVTIHDVQPRRDIEAGGSQGSAQQPVGALRLRGGPRRSRQRVAWDEDVVDNEGAGRKKSKSMSLCYQFMVHSSPGASVCCIYHKPKRFDESSDEDSSDSDSESDCGHGHEHRRTHSHGRGGPGPTAERSHREGGVIHELESDPEPNAYEVAPASKKGKRNAT